MHPLALNDEPKGKGDMSVSRSDLVRLDALDAGVEGVKGVAILVDALTGGEPEH
jgi:hypothetical protein